MTDIEKNLIELVISRLQTMPENLEISIGSEGTFKKKDLIKHVKKSDPIGKMIVKVELDYLRSLKNITQSVLNNA